MISVSDSWKELQTKQVINKECLIEISMEIFDTSVYTASVYAVDKVPYCKATDIIRETDYAQNRIGCFDLNYWLLDGSRNVLPSNTEQDNTGYISTLDYYPNSIEIYNLDGHHTIKDIRITFDDYFCCRDFIITFSNGGTIIKTIEINDNTDLVFTYNVGESISNYTNITISVSDSGNQRVRIKKVELGTIKVFTNKDIISYKMSSSVSPINNSLPQNTINFEIDNMDNTFNPDNPLGYFDTLSKRQKIEIRYGFNFDTPEYINGGTFYLTEWDTPQNGLTATFTAKNIISFFNMTYYGGVNYSYSLYELAEQVFQYANWELVNTDIDSSLANIITNAPLPNVSCAECLQLIAQASNCALYVDNNNKVCIKPISFSSVHLDYTISNFLSYDYPELEISDEISFIEIAVNSYTTNSNSEKIYEGEVYTDTKTIIFGNSNDYRTITSDSSSTATFSIDDITSYMCSISVSGNGSLVLKGCRLEQNAMVYTIDNDKDGDDLEISNALITTRDNAISVGNYIQERVNERYTDSVSFRIDPRLELLDIVRVQGKLATTFDLITSLDIEFNGAFKGSIKGNRNENIIIPLTFTALENNTQVGYTITGSLSLQMEYSFDGYEWFSWNGENITINNGKELYVRNLTNTLSTNSNYISFTGSGRYNVSGNILSLLNYGSVSNYCFTRLFAYNLAIISAENIIMPNATAQYFCSGMFLKCEYLEKPIKDMVATSISNFCYNYMYGYCISLSFLPKLLANTMKQGCYRFMFYHCTNIKISETQTEECKYEYRLPYSGTGVSASNWSENMFLETSGTFAGTPEINTTYYTNVEVL